MYSPIDPNPIPPIKPPLEVCPIHPEEFPIEIDPILNPIPQPLPTPESNPTTPIETFNKKDITKAKIFITGAGGGLGLALAKNLVKSNKFKLILTARGQSLSNLKYIYKDNPDVQVEELDLLNNNQITNLCKKINDQGGIDCLINNAAIVYSAVVEHVCDEDEKKIFQTNYFAPRELIRNFIPLMKLKKGGKVINISSVGGMMAMPTMSSYSASKFALEGMSEALYYELKPYNIEVYLVEMGFVNSNSFQKTIITNLAKDCHELIYQNYYLGMQDFIHRIMNHKLNWNSSKSIADIICDKAIFKKDSQFRLLVSYDAHFFSFWRRFSPRRIYHWFLYKFLPQSIKKSYFY